MKLPLARALQYRRDKIVETSPKVLKRCGIVGESQAVADCLALVSQAAGSDTGVLITGETGTGKELFARAIHENSRRASKSLVVVDCTALPETLVESLLFGHERGSFTGAERSQEGLIKQAHGGTLFLDEVGELPLPVQKSFLRVLQERRFRPIGGTKEIDVDFRLVAATNRDLDQMAKDGSFRQDLLFRLRSFTIALPPLRNHREDIHELMVYHLSNLCQRYNITTKGFSPDVLEAFRSYEWPGNVRELVNALERALAAAWHEPTLFAKHLPQEIRIKLLRRSIQRDQGYSGASGQIGPKPLLSWKETRDAGLDKLEYEYLRDLMAHTKGDVNEALEISGLKRSRLYQLLKKHGLSARG